MNCFYCHKLTPKLGKRYKKYCNIRCKIQYDKNNYKPKPKHTEKEKKCTRCGNIYITKNPLTKYCSRICCTKAQKQVRLNKKPKSKKCTYCQDEFTPYTSLDKFCSANCRIANQKSKRSWNWQKESCDKITGVNNPAYRNGNFVKGHKRTEIRQRKFLRIRNEIRQEKIKNYGFLFCDKCNTNNTYSWEMHHIVYRSEKPKHEHLHNKQNLIDLCMKCHNWFHNKKDRRNYLIEERKLTELFGNEIL